MPPLSNYKYTGEEPSSLHNSKHTKHTHATRVQTQHSTVTALHRSKGVQPNDSPARIITVALDMSKALDTIHMHTVIRKLLQTSRIPGTIIKFITNYIKGHKAYTTYRNHTSTQRQFKTGILSHTQYFHCRHTTTQSTGSGHVLSR